MTNDQVPMPTRARACLSWSLVLGHLLVIGTWALGIKHSLDIAIWALVLRVIAAPPRSGSDAAWRGSPARDACRTAGRSTRCTGRSGRARRGQTRAR